MKFTQLSIPGVWLIEPKRFGDARGYFMETFKIEEFRAHVGNVEFVQENESFSSFGVLRGLHFQKGDKSQAKLVRVSQGKVVDVAVDLRKSSPTFKQHITVELSADNGLQLYVPRGFAHGFVVLSEYAQFQYKVDNIYSPQTECTLLFNDPELAIEWPISEQQMLLSDKDRIGFPLNKIEFFD